MYTHIRIDLIGAHYAGNHRHAQQIMKDLDLTYEQAVPQSIADAWQFFNVKGDVSNLPEYVRIFDSEPLSYVGFGLSEDMAMNLTNLDKEESTLYLNRLKEEYNKTSPHNTDEGLVNENASSKNTATYNPEDIILTIGGVEFDGFSNMDKVVGSKSTQDSLK